MRFKESVSRNPVAWSLAVAALLTFLLFPGFALGLKFPMLIRGKTSALQDPNTSPWVFIPGFRVLRYELFHHFQWLWSNLRSFGMPLLGNEIQAAPLFPLTWLTLLIPEPWTWNVLVLARFILMAWAALLIATQSLNFRRAEAVFFALVLVFPIYVVRWLNHAWTNGLIAGLWYFYFLERQLRSSSRPLRNSFGTFSALVVAVYSMVVCGFPESAAMNGLLAALVLFPLALAQARSDRRSFGRWVFRVAWAHLLGFALASFQIFPLFELMREAGPALERDMGRAQFASLGVLLTMVFRVTDAGPPTIPVVAYVGLIPLFFFLSGLRVAFARFREKRVADLGAWVSLVFALLKLFPVWAFFNRVVGSLPVFRDTWFINYGLMPLIWPIAYFSALGLGSVLRQWEKSDRDGL